MSIRWGPGMIGLALLAMACVPVPVGRASPVANASPTATGAAVPTPVGPPPSIPITHPTPLPPPPFTAYVVTKGDTLTSIAKQFGTTGRSIAYWNRVTYPSLDPDSPKYKPNRLERGWILQLIPNHEVDPEDLPTLSPVPTPSSSAIPSASPSASG